MSDPLDALLDPIGELARQDAEFDWTSSDSLVLDERYRRRQLPLLEGTPAEGLTPDHLRTAETWPPARSAVLPINNAALLADRKFSAFLDDLRRSGLRDIVWWEGIDRRAERVHATVAPALDPSYNDVSALRGPVSVRVRGPWLGRYNRGRMYLPIEAADLESAQCLAEFRRRIGAQHRALLAGYLQLSDGVTGRQFGILRDLVSAYQRDIAVLLNVRELWLLDAMDDLVLRSEIHARIPIGTGHFT